MESTKISELKLIHNAKIWRSGEKDFDWMTFHPITGYIHQLGRGALPDWVGGIKDDQRVDCGGKRVLPGLHESHIHVLQLGKSLKAISFKGCNSPEAMKDQIRQYSVENPGNSWVVGAGWEQDRMGRYPTRQDLDEICPDRPVMVVRACMHVVVVNSAGLKLAGITKDTPDPEGGTIVHSKTDGELTGMLEENAVELATVAIPPLTSETKIEMIKNAIQLLLKNGVTAAHACEEGTWNEFCKLADEDQLPIRIFFSAFVHPPTPGNYPKAGERRGAMLSCDRIKLFTDGALGAATAAISLPYRGSCNHGTLLQTQDTLSQEVRDATSQGFRLEVHAIGDQGAEALLNALDTVPVAKERRPILTHCQILRDDIIERMQKNGVIANIQPQFVPTDARWILDLLPDQLLKQAYAWKTLLDKGIVCAGGSDAPIEAPAPLVGMYDAIYREYGDPPNKQVFRPDECLTLTQAVDLYTKGGAYATMKEAELGQLMPGYQADFIVLDTDVTLNPRDLLKVKAEQVWVAGVRKFSLS